MILSTGWERNLKTKMMKHNNKWIHGTTNLVMPELPAGFMHNAGIFYLTLVLDKSVGDEVVLIIFDPTDFIFKLSAVVPFRFYTSSVAIFSFIFYVTNPGDERKAFAVYDKPIDISKPQSFEPWIKLAGQTHLHLLLLDKNYEVQGFYEFENSSVFNEALEIITQLDAGRIIDFKKAEQEYFNNYSLPNLYALVRNNDK